MSSHPELMSLLGQWRLLTQRENEAILSEDWNLLAAHQRQKALLRTDIGRLIKPGGEPLSARLATLVPELIALEKRNRDLLNAKGRRTQAELERLQQTTRNLNGVRRAYAGAAQSQWHSYS